MVDLISDKISSIYTKAEDKYFDLLDALDDRGIPVYTYSDFFEEKGIPSFIVTITILFLLILLMGFAVSGPMIGSNELSLTIRDQITGEPLQNANLTIFDSENKILKTSTVSDGDVVTLSNYSQGTNLKILIEKEGYENATDEFLIGENTAVRNLYLSKQFVGINARLRVTNVQTGSSINNATVSARYGDQVYNFFSDGNGIYKKTSFPQGETVLLSIKADGYEPIQTEASFFQDRIKDFTMSPGEDSFVGLAKVVLTISDESGNAIDGANVTIYNKQNQAILVSQESEQGAITTSIQTQIPLKITVEKEGFLIYDSDSELGGITITTPEERLDLTLKQGGKELVVNVVNDLGLNLSDVIIQVFDQKGNRITREITTSSGATLSGLDPNQTVIITAHKDGYLPNQSNIFVGSTETLPIILKEALSGNSFGMDIFSIDTLGEIVPGANIEILVFEEDGNKIPYGFENLRTSIAGYIRSVVGLNKTYLIKAENEIMKGEKIIEITENTTDSKVYITMSKKEHVIELNLLDLLGEKVRGNATISTTQEEILYDGNIVDGKIFFNSQNKEVVLIEVETDSGVNFSEEIYVKGKEIINLTIYDKENSDLSPIIDFVGLETIDGEETRGITPGAFYYAKFNVKWPLAAQKGGVHFRAGSDNIEFADSENIAIYDLSLTEGTTFLSYSFNPEPKPGNESIDRSNQGFFDEANKWVEGIIDNPKGNYIAKVKIRASEFSTGKIELKYRAWSEIDSFIYRTPKDDTLLEDAFNEEKASLYAETSKVDITLFESLPECTDNICVAYNFTDEEGNYYDLKNFEAMKGKVYALEVEFNSSESDYLQVNVQTDSNLSFLGTQTSSFKFIENSDFLNSKEASAPITLNANGKQKLRIYFIAKDTGANIINFNASGNEEITKEISFTSVSEKEMLVELTNNKVSLGQDITVKVLNTNLTGVEDALIKVIDKEGAIVKSVKGDGRDKFGKNGKYTIKNDLEQGVYTIQVNANKYKTKTQAVLVTAQDVLSIEQEIKVNMLLNEKTKIITTQLNNNSVFDVTNISINQESENFDVSAQIIPTLNKNSSQNITLTIKYIGDTNNSNEIITLDIKGMIEGKFLTSTSTKINANYNQKIDTSCLKFTPSKVKLAMVGNTGASANETVEVKNDCDMPLTLTAIPIEKTKRSNVKVTSEGINLAPGRTNIITINATNFADRLFNRNENYEYEIKYESETITKTLPVSVELINPKIALSFPGQITLFLSQDSAGAKAVASQPIFVTNVSKFPVEGIKFSQNKEYANESNVSVRIVPPETVSLEAGQAMQPKLLFAEGSSRFAEPVNTQIHITGRLGELNNRIDNRDNYNYLDFINEKQPIQNYNNSSRGYTSSNDLLGVIDVLIYYSGFDCLKASLDTTAFNLTAEGLGRAAKLTVQNTCAEPVRLLDVKATYPGLISTVPNIMVGPNQTVETQMMIGVMGSTTKLTNYPITIRALTTTSQTTIQTKPIAIDVFAGVNFNEEYSKADEGIVAKTCSGEEVTISLPRNASNGDCANGYCDGQEAAEYIAKKLDTAIKKAEAQAYSAQKKDDQSINLSKGFVTLGDIGVQKTSFDLYLKNDTIGTNALKDAFAKYSSNKSGFSGLGTGDYQFDTGKVNVQTLAGIARSGYGRQVIIDDSLQGCGYYRLEIDGVFPITAEGVSFLMPILTVQVQPIISDGKITTKECVASIENLSNFTPIDEKYKIGNTGGTWLTSIEADKSLTNMAKELSKEFVGNETRFGIGSGNKIILKEAALSNMLAEVCLIKGEKAVIDVKVNSELGESNETTREGLEKEVVKLVMNAINGNFGENCIVSSGDGYNCVKLSDLSGLGEGLNLKLASNTLNINKNGGCVNAVVSSPYPESVEFTFKKLEDKKDFSNITELTITSDESDQNIFYKAEFTGSKIIKETINTAELLQRNNDKDAKYARNVRICVKSNPTSYLHAQGVSFSIKAINKSAGKRETNEKDGTLTITTDSLHPDDLIAILTNKNMRTLIPGRGEKSPYYFTITWKDEPNEIKSLATYYGDLRDLKLQENTFVQSHTGGVENTEKGNEIVDDGRKKALGVYLGTCFGVSTVCNVGTGLVGTAFNGLTDCLIPAAVMLKADTADLIPPLRNFYGFMGEIPLIGDAFKIPSKLPEPKAWDPFEPIALAGGAGGATQRAIANLSTYGSKGNIGYLNSGAVDWGASQVKEAYTQSIEKTIKETFSTEIEKTVLDKFTKEYTDVISKEFNKQYTKLYKEEIKKASHWYKHGRRTTLSPEKANEIFKLATDHSQTEGLKWMKEGKITGFDGPPGEYLIKQGNATGSLKPDDLINKMNPNSSTREYLQRIDPQSKLNTTVNSKLGTISDDVISKIDPTDFTSARTALEGEITPKVKLIVKDMFESKGLSSSQIDEIAKKVLSKIDPSDYDTMLAHTINTVSTKKGLYEVSARGILGGQVETIVSKSITDTISETPELSNLLKSEVDNLGQVLGRDFGAKTSLDDFAERGARSKIKNFFKPKMIGSIARGFGCGVLSNMAGLWGYQNSITKSNKEIEELIDILPQEPLIKDEMYKMIIETKIKGAENIQAGIKAKIYHIDKENPELIDEMEKALSGKEEIKGMTLKWSDKMNEKQPGERPLKEYLLNTSAVAFRTMLENEKGFEDKKEIDLITSIIANTYSQKLIYRYSNPEGKDSITIKGQLIPESWVGSIVALGEYTNEELEKEFKTDKESEKIVKSKVKKLIELVNKNEKIMITQKISRELFGDEDTADKFFTLTKAWDNILGNKLIQENN